MNKELIDTVESLGGTALMGGILVQFSDTNFTEALKKIYEAGVEAEREACALRAEEFLTEPEPDWDGDFWNQAIERVALAIRARGQA